MKFFPLVPVIALFGVFSGAVQAERADRNKPMQLEADRMQHDETRMFTVLTGQVHAVKGTLVMRSARMEVQQDAQGQQVAHFWADPGQRVYFRQKREGVEEFVEGEALQAVYDSRLDQVTLTDKGEVRILREGRVADQLFGQTIVYNNSTEVLNVDDKQRDPSSGGRQRVRAVLAPRAEAAAAAPVPAPAPALRPSTSLSTGGKP